MSGGEEADAGVTTEVVAAESADVEGAGGEPSTDDGLIVRLGALAASCELQPTSRTQTAASTRRRLDRVTAQRNRNRTSHDNLAEHWIPHVEFVAETFGDLVAGWQPINEADYYSQAAYGGWGWPPGVDDRTQRALVDEIAQLANAEAAVRLRRTGAPVSSTFGLSAFVAQDDEPSSAAMVDGMYAALWSPGLGLFRDGVLAVPGREPITRADLAGAFDLIGFSYYATLGVKDGRPAVHPPGAERSPLGYGIYTDGLGLVLDCLHAELPGTPLLVAEYGIDVSGLFHWTAVDNYEWLHGYDVAFGIIDRARVVKPSAAILRRAALR